MATCISNRTPLEGSAATDGGGRLKCAMELQHNNKTTKHTLTVCVRMRVSACACVRTYVRTLAQLVYEKKLTFKTY